MVDQQFPREGAFLPTRDRANSSAGALGAAWARLRAAAFEPVDIAALVYFRVAFGLIMLWEVWRYFNADWITRYWVAPTFHFKYFGFDWVHVLPGSGMYILFYALGVLSIFIAAGVLYRVSMTLFFVGFTYMFLLDASRYLNHFYLIVLISFLMIFIPAHRALSVDAWLRPGLRSQTAPAWALWLLRFQLGVVYFFGGVAKLNGDWLFRGEPMRMWLAARTDFPIIGPLFTQEWMVYAMSWGGMLLDLLFVPLVLWRKTRPLILLAALLFHLMNARLFTIGIFPWFMIAANLLFLPPGWPRLRWLRRGAAPSTPAADTAHTNPHNRLPGSVLQNVILTGLVAWCCVQIALPLRHFLYPGDVNWTEQGHRWAWHMKLRDKAAWPRFFAYEPATATRWEIDPYDYIDRRQLGEMTSRPDMILQFAHYVAASLESEGYRDVEIYTFILASLNGREPQLLIDPNVDLAAQPWDLWHASWIMPLDESLESVG